MADPQAFQVRIRVVAFGTTAAELRDRVEATIRTHPTLSFRFDTITVSAETPPNFDDAMFKNIRPIGDEVDADDCAPWVESSGVLPAWDGIDDKGLALLLWADADGDGADP